MLPKHLQVYYSGLVYNTNHQTDYLYIQPCSYFSNYEYTTLTVYVQTDLSSPLLSLEYLAFQSSILANTYFSVLSDFSIHDKVSYDSFTCDIDLSRLSYPPQEDRKYDYNLSVDNPVELDIYEGTVDGIQGEVVYPSYTGIRELSFTGLPDAIGTASIVDNTDINTKWLLPSNTTGWLGNFNLSTDMSDKPLEGISFALLTSCVYKDLDLIILQLREFINQSKQMGYILQDSSNAWYIDPDVMYGFYPTLNLLTYDSQYEFKELPHNCLLLISLCSALQTITDAPLTLEYTFDGMWGDFKEQLLLCLRAQALFVSNSISPVSNLCAYRTEGDYYTYNTLSYSASCYAAIGLSLYLSYSYDSYIHTQASRLQSNLLNLPTDVFSPIYSNLIERDLTLITLQHEQAIVDNDIYNKQLCLGAQLWWKSYYDPDSITETVDAYQSIYTIYNITESIFVSLLSSIGIAIPSFLGTSGLVNLVTDKPNFTALAASETLFINTTSNIAQVFSGAVISQTYSLATNYFDLVSIKSSAFVTAMLLELRRMMPFGLKWFDESKVNDISSVIGSMLYAEADLYWNWIVQFDTMYKSASPFTAVSENAQAWFNSKYNQDILATDGRLRQLNVIDSTKDTTTIEGLCNFLSEFLGIDASYTRPQLPSFSVYKPNSVEDLLSNYTVNNQTVDFDTGYFTQQQYLSIAFKREASNWIPRIVPGLPIKPTDKPIDVDVMSIEDYIANPVKGVVVADGPIYLYPLTDYVMQTTLSLSDTPRMLKPVLDSTAPAGLLLDYESSLEFIGEE